MTGRAKSEEIFKVGDILGSMWGDCELEEFYPKHERPIGIRLASGTYKVLNEDGTADNDSVFPSIWHKETGTAPTIRERPFEYPLWFKDNHGQVVKFKSLNTGTMVISRKGGSPVGSEYIAFYPHTDMRLWAPCGEPDL